MSLILPHFIAATSTVLLFYGSQNSIVLVSWHIKNGKDVFAKDYVKRMRSEIGV